MLSNLLKQTKAQDMIISILYYSKKQKGKVFSSLRALFNSSPLDGTVPAHWKMANITPIFKKKTKKVPLV